MIKVSEDMVTGIYTIQVEAFEPQFAADLNNMIIDELDKHQKAYNSSLKSEARIFIQERIFQVEKELSVIENKLKEFRDRNRRIENFQTYCWKKKGFPEKLWFILNYSLH